MNIQLLPLLWRCLAPSLLRWSMSFTMWRALRERSDSSVQQHRCTHTNNRSPDILPSSAQLGSFTGLIHISLAPR
jgi:hypothetical protein